MVPPWNSERYLPQHLSIIYSFVFLPFKNWFSCLVNDKLVLRTVAIDEIVSVGRNVDEIVSVEAQVRKKKNGNNGNKYPCILIL